jgi:1-deoxy-D-xylulose-5-phosphate reductoisomerase
MKRVAILGSTGSIGQSALSVIAQFGDEFSVAGLSTSTNIDLLQAQIKRFKPRLAAVAEDKCYRILSKNAPCGTKIVCGTAGLEAVATQADVDIVLVAISGFSALPALLAAIKAGKDIALANKEALVSAGSLVSKEVKRNKVNLIPVDSEQCAIFQCLSAEDNATAVRTMFLTASGGPLYFRKKELKKITRRDVLKHPRWSMGPKISVDSATLMNKGLEVIEAKWLFGIDVDKIKVLIHPEAIVHSMVEFIDGSVLAQMSITDMKLPIQFALSFPQRLVSPFPHLDFAKVQRLHFFKPDTERFPALSLAYRAARMKTSALTVLNAANEEAVEAFLADKLDFSRIVHIVDKTLRCHRAVDVERLEDIFKIDTWARLRARELTTRL